MTREPFACVLGDMDLVRPLHLAGIPIAVAAPDTTVVRYSRVVTNVVEYCDPFTHGEDLADRLESFSMSQDSRPVLLYQTDGDLLFVSRHRERLSRHFSFIIPEGSLVEDLVDKSRFESLATNLGLPVPATTILSRGIVDLDIVDGMKFPLIVKPFFRRASWEKAVKGLAKAVRVDSRERLHELLVNLFAVGCDVVVQELIPGPESRIESYHVFIDEDGAIIAEFTGRKLRTKPRSYGQTTALTITRAEDVAELGRHLVKRVGLTGVAKLDFKRDPDGSLWLLEINPRFTLWHYPGALAGVNIPAIVWASLTGRRWAPSTDPTPGVTWCIPWSDAIAARQCGMPLDRWAAWAWRSDAKHIIAWNDPLPFLYRIWHKLLRVS